MVWFKNNKSGISGSDEQTLDLIQYNQYLSLILFNLIYEKLDWRFNNSVFQVLIYNIYIWLLDFDKIDPNLVWKLTIWHFKF